MQHCNILSFHHFSILSYLMQDIKQREVKMQEKRKQTPRREFIKTIPSLRTMWFYKNNGLTTIFPQTERIKWVVSHKEFEQNKDNLLNQWRMYDFNMGFFENFQALFTSIDFPPTWLSGDCENANFTDQTVSIKNCYLSYVVIRDCENVFYSLSVKEHSINIFNSFMVRDTCENVYFSKGIIKSFNIFHSKHIVNSSNIWFSTNLIGCSECVLCNNLNSQSYCIENKQYTQEEYFQKKQELLQQKDKFFGRYLQLPDQGNNIWSSNSSGNYNIECNDIENGYYNAQIKEWRNIILIGGKEAGERVYDSFLNTPSETDVYGVFSTWFCSNIYNSYQISGGANIYYSSFLENCSHCLWCIGLKNKEFCIFNRQYSKDDRFTLANQIFQKMDAEWILWLPFPWHLNPFYFNDTAAYLIDDSFTKEEVTKEWYLRRDEEIKVDVPTNAEIITTKELVNYQRFDDIWEWNINSEILKKVIRDEMGNYYRIVPMELDFLQKFGLPLPEIHWLERIKLWFKFK